MKLFTFSLFMFFTIHVSAQHELPCNPFAPGYELQVLTNQVYETDTEICADRLVLKAGGRITLKNGIKFRLRVKTLHVEGSFVIDGRGNPGQPGAPNRFGSWTSKGPSGGFGGCGTGHDEWVVSGTHSNDVGGAGSAGGNGSTVIVEYKNLSGISGGLNNLQIYTEGGEGGKGSIGLKLICGCHNTESKYGPSGQNGSRGINGSYIFKHQ